MKERARRGRLRGVITWRPRDVKRPIPVPEFLSIRSATSPASTKLTHIPPSCSVLHSAHLYVRLLELYSERD